MVAAASPQAALGRRRRPKPARPYADAHGADAVPKAGHRPPSMTGRALIRAPRKLLGRHGQGRRIHLLVVATAERGLCARPFNSSIANRAGPAPHRRAARARARQRQDPVPSAARAADQLRARDYGADHRATMEIMAGGKKPRTSFVDGRGHIGERILGAGRCSRPMASSMCVTLFYSRFKSVMSQVPTEQQLIPIAPWEAMPAAEGGARPIGRTARFTSTSRRKRRSSPICCRATCRSRSIGRSYEKRRFRAGSRMAAMDNATRNAGEMINEPDAQLQPAAPGR